MPSRCWQKLPPEIPSRGEGCYRCDIKPTNIFVTLHEGVPVPKVIDFGIAKATGQQLTEKTLFTNFAQFVGTPLYMSPEQAMPESPMKPAIRRY